MSSIVEFYCQPQIHQRCLWIDLMDTGWKLRTLVHFPKSLTLCYKLKVFYKSYKWKTRWVINNITIVVTFFKDRPCINMYTMYRIWCRRFGLVNYDDSGNFSKNLGCKQYSLADCTHVLDLSRLAFFSHLKSKSKFWTRRKLIKNNVCLMEGGLSLSVGHSIRNHQGWPILQ